MFVREHLEPTLVQVRTLRAVFHPDVHFSDVFRAAAGDLEDLAHPSPHLVALGLDSLGKFSGVRLLSGHSAGYQKRPHPASGRDGIVVLKTGYFDADSAAHEFSFRIIYATLERMKAVWIEQTGGPEALQFGDRPIPEPGAGEVLVRLSAAGVNYTDISQRSGSNKIPLPAVLGSEGAGTVERVGADVSSFKPGDRVAYSMVRGSYAEYAAVPAKMLVKIPEGIDIRTAAAAMLQGMTAHYLSHSTFALKAGHTALIHAAAGGTGRLVFAMAIIAGGRGIEN